jgi:hypothetical protein
MWLQGKVSNLQMQTRAPVTEETDRKKLKNTEIWKYKRNNGKFHSGGSQRGPAP